MRALSARAIKVIAVASVPLSMVASAIVVSQASYSVYSATTTNPNDAFSTGTVALSDDDSGSAMFTASALKPGATGTRCITVTSTGTLPSAIKLYTQNASRTNALDTYLTLTITQGTGGSFSSCSGFTALQNGSSVYSGTLANLTSSNTSYSNGLAVWSTAGGAGANEQRTFQFTYTLSSSAPNSTQGSSAQLDLTWEAQNS